MSTAEAIGAVGAKFKIRQIRRWQQRDEIDVECGGRKACLRVRKHTSDAEVVWQCFVADQYEVPTIPGVQPIHLDAVEQTYARLVQAGKTPLIVDCGANIGASAVWFKLRWPRSAVVAVEPASANLALLEQNCAGLESVSIVAGGVGAEDGDAFLNDGGGGHWGYQTGSSGNGGAVRIVSLAGLIERNASDTMVPFILKIDVEGAEKELFDHSLPTIASFPLIIFEPHDFYMPGARTASPFFKFHAASGRDFLFHYENVFSMDMTAMRTVANGA